MDYSQIALDLARERQEELIAAAARERRIARDRVSIRRSLGRRVVAVGERIAAEPALELARSR